MLALLACADTAVALVLIPPTPNLRPRDLLVSDSADERVLLYRPATGETFPFSPRLGSGPNLLDRPQGIVVDPAGSVYGASEQTGKQIRIDPETGAQSVVHARDGLGDDLGELDVGMYVRALAIRKTASFLDVPDLYVSGGGTLRVVTRGFLGSISTSVVSDDNEFDTNYSHIAIREVGNVVTDLLVAGYGGVTRYEADTEYVYRAIFSGDMHDVEAIGTRIFIAQADPCGPSPFPQSGIWEAEGPAGGDLAPISIAGFIDCPLDLAIYSEAEFYVLQHDDFDTRSLVRLDLQGGTWSQVYLGELGDSTAEDTFQMAVVPPDYAPEPDALGLGAAGAISLAALGRRPRQTR